MTAVVAIARTAAKFLDFIMVSLPGPDHYGRAHRKWCAIGAIESPAVRVAPLLFLFIAAPLLAQDTAAIDKTVGELLTKSGAPSASIAIVKDGKITYEHAYGMAKIDPPTPATS